TALTAGIICLLILAPWRQLLSVIQVWGAIFYKRFELSYRVKIAYIIAIILTIGTFILFLRNRLAAWWVKKWQEPALHETSPAEKAPEKNRARGKYENIILPGLAFLLMALGIFMSRQIPFVFVFALFALPVIWLLATYRDEEKKLVLLGFLIIFLFWFPYVFQGQDTHVKTFDNLDCHVPHTKVLAESGKAFCLDPAAKLPNFINGLPLSGVDSGYNVMTWLFMIFAPFTAYALNDLLIRLVAFWGLFLLLKRYIIKSDETHDAWIIFGSALCFSLLPFYPAGGLSVAGMPLLFYSFFNILERRQRPLDFVIILIFPFYSKLALAGFFVMVVLFIIFLIDWLRKKKLNLYYLGGLVLMTAGYIFAQFHLIYSFLAPGFNSHREEIRVVGLTTAEALKRSILSFIFDRVNEVGAQHLFVMGAAALAVIVALFKKITARLMTWLIIATMLTAALWGFKYWGGIIAIREKFQLLNAFDFSRFYWFNPFLWYVIFALALVIISKIKLGKVLVTLFIICQLLYMFVNYNWEYRYLLGIRSSFAGSPLAYSLSYKEYYSENLFKEIGQFIGKPRQDYRVASIGLQPGISQYNGFYTLDIYTDIYPLAYKHQFRRIIEKELEKSALLRKTFDETGKRCFLFAAELSGIKRISGEIFSRGITKMESRGLKIKNLEINSTAMKEMGGRYIFSAVEILNYAQNGLSFERIFENNESPWKIYLYKVN
ncbi:MAG TPA: DUF6044 family protein, partial [Candidatus Kapabacteria bacterium]|nr:DUF6044 family protein [Candidatus Kapabacteria bacterium]